MITARAVSEDGGWAASSFSDEARHTDCARHPVGALLTLAFHFSLMQGRPAGCFFSNEETKLKEQKPEAMKEGLWDSNLVSLPDVKVSVLSANSCPCSQ